MIVLDTNVLSELMKPSPEARVAVWVAAQPATSLFTTTVTQAEILVGLALLPRGRRREALEKAAVALFDEDLAGRVIAFDSAAAQACAKIVPARYRAGRPISQYDAQIAAIAASRGAGIATRNTADFDGCGILLFNPWKS